MEGRDAALIAEWRRSPPWRWAAESYRVTLDPAIGYCSIFFSASACVYAPGRPVYVRGAEQRRSEVTNAYLDRFEPVVELRLRQAAYRLAHLINTALDPGYAG